MADLKALSNQIELDVALGNLSAAQTFTKMRDLLNLALSHAAGQDGDQCRAASVEPDAWLYEYEHDGESDHCLSRVRFLPSWVEAKRATEHPLYLRALSRGVPEGKDGERYRYLCERHPLKMQRWLVGEVAEGKIDRKDLIDAAVDEQMARDYAAIAAQRKEGE